MSSLILSIVRILLCILLEAIITTRDGLKPLLFVAVPIIVAINKCDKAVADIVSNHNSKGSPNYLYGLYNPFTERI